MAVNNTGNIFKETISALLSIIEVYDSSLKENSERIASHCIMFCRKLKLSKEESEKIYFAGLLHDIGMFHIPVDIIHKKDKLTEDEIAMLKMHPAISEKIISNISFLKGVLPIVRHHHERFDGSGYPEGKKGSDIPYGSRIIALADTYDAMLTGRSYKDKKAIEEIIEEVEKESGKQFDPDLVKEFLQFLKPEDASDEVSQRSKEEDKKEIIQKTINGIITSFKKGQISLPSLPTVVQDVQKAIDNPVSTTDDVAKLIETDSVISLRLISIANSAVYRGADKIQNVKQAVPRLGLKQTKSVVVAIANKSIYQTDNIEFKEILEKMWLHALACAYVSRMIGIILKEENVDDLFLMGLTHDIGKVMLFKPFTDILAQTESINLDEVMESIQEAHCGMGSALLAKLGFSDAFVRVARMHNNEKFTDVTLKYILIVSLANILTRKIGYSLHEGTDIDLAEVNSAKLLKLDAAELEDVCAKVKQTMEDAASKF
jgi:HD-GYP domain-containing protein (c-di-GMP phosphodiesterase class II)